jgi:hypothetical protein
MKTLIIASLIALSAVAGTIADAQAAAPSPIPSADPMPAPGPVPSPDPMPDPAPVPSPDPMPDPMPMPTPRAEPAPRREFAPRPPKARLAAPKWERQWHTDHKRWRGHSPR